MNMSKTLWQALLAGGLLVVFTVGAFFALGVKSVVIPAASAQLSAPNPGHNYDQIGLPEGTWPNLDADKLDGYDSSEFGGGGSCYTNWNDSTCAPGWTAVSTGEWTSMLAYLPAAIFAGTVVCASPKAEGATGSGFNSTTASGYLHTVNHEPCAICCK